MRFSESKRSADESPGRPEAKKARVGVDIDVDATDATSGVDIVDEHETSDTNGDTPSPSKKKKNEKGSFKEDPFTLVSPEDKVVQACLYV